MSIEQQPWYSEYWHSALNGEKLPMSENSPQPGFYKRRRGGERDGAWEPILFKRSEDGRVICGYQGRAVDPLEHWTWAAKNAITRDVYLSYDFKNGLWPDEPKEEVRSNLPADPAERVKALLMDRFEVIGAFFEATPKIETQEQCDRASNIVAPTIEHLKEADELRKKLKKPHDEAAKAVQEQFRYCEQIADMAKLLKKMMGEFADREEKRLKVEALKKQREEQARLDAERKALEAQDIALAAATPREIAKLDEAPKVQAGGLTGRKQGFRPTWDAEVVDHKAALEHFAEYEEVKNLVKDIAQRMVRKFQGKVEIPGVLITERKIAA